MKSFQKRSASILLATIVSSTIVTTSATADAASTVISKVAKVVAQETFSTCFKFGANVAFESLFGSGSSEAELSDESLQSIGFLIEDAFNEYQTTTTMNGLDDLMSNATSYSTNRDTTSLLSTERSITYADAMASDSTTVLNQLDDFSYEFASSYQSIAAMRLGYLKDAYELRRVANTFTTPPTYGMLLGIVGTSAARGDIADDAAGYYDVLSEMEADWETDLSGLYNIARKQTHVKDSNVYPHCIRTVKRKYCSTDSSGDAHCGYSYECKYYGSISACNSDGNAFCTNGDEDKAKSTANQLREGVKKLERDIHLGESFDENMEYLYETDRYGLEYCGNGQCALGEIDSCSVDCYAMTSSAAGTTVMNGAIDLASSQARTLLSNSQAHLDWTSTGNLVLYNWSGEVLWSTNLAANTADRVKFQTDGNLVLYGPGGAKWAAASNAWGNKMVLVGRELHIVSSANATLWSSNRVYKSGTFSTSQGFTLAWSNEARLVWQADGNLSLYRNNNYANDTVAWTAGTNGVGAQLVISGGTITIKNSAGATVWSNFGSVSRPNSYLELVGDQVRTRVTQGGYSTWSSASCTLASCKDDRNARDTSIGYCFDASQAHTLLSNDDAKLNWQSDGNLVILNASGNPRWASNTGGYIGEYVCFQTDGNLVIYDSSWSAKWAASWTSSEVFGANRLSLDSCNLSVTNSSGKVLYGTNVNCY